MIGLWHDTQYALRLLRKSPAFTLIAAGTLALGIGANTVVFTCVESFLLKPLPYAEPSRLTLLKQTTNGGSNTSMVTSADYQDWRNSASSFASLGACQIDTFAITAAQPGGAAAQRIRGAHVDPGFFRTLAVQPQLGRFFGPGEGSPGAGSAVILSDAYWQQHFNRAPDALGRSIVLDGTPHTVVGIAPAHLSIPMGFNDLLVPLTTATAVSDRRNHSLSVIGRLKDGVTIDAANSELTAIAGRLAGEHPATNQGWSAVAWDLHTALSQAPRRLLTVLLAAVALVLLICCANIANLLMARGATRAREMAMRGALGASRWRLVRQLLVESGVLAILGGAFGILIARWGVDGCNAVLPPILRPAGGLQMDTNVLAFVVLLCLGTGFIFGLLPAIRVMRSGSNEALKEGARAGATNLGRSRMAAVLVTAEVTLAVFLLACAGLVMGSLVHMQDQDLGFQPQGVLTAEIGFRSDRYRQPAQQVLLMENLLSTIQALPGVEVAAATTFPPMTAEQARQYEAEGRAPAPKSQPPSAAYQASTPGYAAAIGARIVKGRFFTVADNVTAEPVAVVNESLARAAFPEQEALGRRIRIPSSDSGTAPAWMRIVGVMADVRHAAMASRPQPELFVPYAQHPQDSTYLALRTAGDPAALARPLQAAIESIDGGLPLNLVRPMKRVMEDALSPARMTASMMSIFAVLALALAAMGLFGVISFLVATRTHEFGVRLALGATSRSLLRLVLGRALLLTAIGTTLGIAGGFAASRVLRSLLFDAIRPDPLIFAGVAALLAATAIFASWVPLRRALALDPVRALHTD